MILEALVRLYEKLREQNKIYEEGWTTGDISFQINIDQKGNLIDIVSLMQESVQGKKKILQPISKKIPIQVGRASNIKSNFLCDNLKYTLGLGKKIEESEEKRFNAFVEFHKNILESIRKPDSDIDAFLLFLEKWNPTGAKKYVCITNKWKELQSGNFLFAVEGRFLTENYEVQRCWNHYVHKSDEGKGDRHRCSVTGELDEIAELHPKIKGVYGGQPMGTSLVSFNAKAFNSYGKKRGENASVGAYAAKAYGVALNYLLRDKKHVYIMGDTTVVCWAENAEDKYPDFFMNLVEGKVEQKPEPLINELYNLMEEIKKGHWIDYSHIKLDANEKFYILGMTPNKGRLSIRFFLEQKFGKILENMSKHYERMEIVKPPYDSLDYVYPEDMFRATVNTLSKNVKPVSQMCSDTMKSIWLGYPYPASLFMNTMIRIRAERRVTRTRAATIKAYFLKNIHSEFPQEVLTVALNENSNNIPYNLGRLFALLEVIQRGTYDTKLNRTIKDTYFNTASTTPANVFPILLRLSEKHQKNMYQQVQLEKIMDKLGETFPNRLSLVEQGSFMLGYYHQIQKLYEKKGGEKNEEQ